MGFPSEEDFVSSGDQRTGPGFVKVWAQKERVRGGSHERSNLRTDPRQGRSSERGQVTWEGAGTAQVVSDEVFIPYASDRNTERFDQSQSPVPPRACVVCDGVIFDWFEAWQQMCCGWCGYPADNARQVPAEERERSHQPLPRSRSVGLPAQTRGASVNTTVRSRATNGTTAGSHANPR